MKVLVTGAGGFIGYNMCLYLLKKGHEVVASYRSNIPDDIESIKKNYGDMITLSKGDLLDENYYKELEGLGITAIMNAAIVTSPDASEIDTFTWMSKANIDTTINLLGFAIKNSIKNYVYVSSSGVYGSKLDTNSKLSEDEELDLFNTYCITKRTCELLVARYGHLTNSKAVSARIAAPYGPYERITNSRTVMSPIYMMLDFASKDKEIKLYGKDVVRDWTYVEDTVGSIYELLVSENLNFTEYNVSNSISYSLEDIACAFKKVFPKFKYIFVDDPKDADVAMYETNQRGALGIARIYEDTGFIPKFPLEKGLEKYVLWSKI